MEAYGTGFHRISTIFEARSILLLRRKTGRAGPYQVDMLPRIQLNIVLSDHNVDRTIETICQAAHTGKAGDGMIFVYPVDDVIRISTGERGHDALMYPNDIDVQREAARKNGK